MKRTLLPPNSHLHSRVGAAILAAALLAGPGLAAPAGAVEPSPSASTTSTSTSSTVTSPADPIPTATALPQAPALDAQLSPSPTGAAPDPTNPADKAAMAAAIAPGGAEMGQRSARVVAPSGNKSLLTEALTTEGSWSPTFGVQGLDVSGHQTSIDWLGQWNMGARFAYVKASEGNYFTNDLFNSQYQGARNVGMIRGAYHFAIPNWSSGADQARYFIQSGGGWTADGYTLPPVLDFEFNPYANRTINGFYFGNTCYDQSPAQLASWVRDFGNTMLAMTGRLPVIYTNTSWWNQCLGSVGGFGDYPLWVAAYPGSPTNNAGPVPVSWSDYEIWQYSSTGPFAGDSNVWNGTYQQLQRFALASSDSGYSPSIRSLSDIVTVGANGDLWNYPSDHQGGYTQPYVIGGGFANTKAIFSTDWNLDGTTDVVAQWNDGRVNVFYGMAAGGFSSPAMIANSPAWAGLQLSINPWRKSDRYPGIAAKDTDGSLWYYNNFNGLNISSGATSLGIGWGDATVTLVDFDGDRAPDILSRRPDGNLALYRTDGYGTFLAEPRQIIGNGWDKINSVSPIQGFDPNYFNGLLGRRADGTLSFYPMNGWGGWGGGYVVPGNWSGLKITGSQDLTPPAPAPAAPVENKSIKSEADVVVIDGQGKLLRYPASGAGGVTAPITIGTGWTGFKAAFPVDWNQDGTIDIVAQPKTGPLTVYLGKFTGGFEAPVTIGSAGFASLKLTVGKWNTTAKYPSVLASNADGRMWEYANPAGGSLAAVGTDLGVGWNGLELTLTEWNGDGNADLLARTQSGSMLLYRTDGKGGFLNEARGVIGTGWSGVTAVSPSRNLFADGKPGLVARWGADQLTAYGFTGTGSWGQVNSMGIGWTPLYVLGSTPK